MSELIVHGIVLIPRERLRRKVTKSCHINGLETVKLEEVERQRDTQSTNTEFLPNSSFGSLEQQPFLMRWEMLLKRVIHVAQLLTNSSLDKLYPNNN